MAMAGGERRKKMNKVALTGGIQMLARGREDAASAGPKMRAKKKTGRVGLVGLRDIHLRRVKDLTNSKCNSQSTQASKAATN